MAGIDTGGGHGGKKGVNQEIPLIPFIDLLLCCVMFLLVSAVWNQFARLEANQQVPGQSSSDEAPEEPPQRLILQIQQTGFVLGSSAGDSETIEKLGEDYDFIELRKKLQHQKLNVFPNKNDIIIAPENGVLYKSVIATMDVAKGYLLDDNGRPILDANKNEQPLFPIVSLSDAATLQ
jgi:biopolymer transport protein ExbD